MTGDMSTPPSRAAHFDRRKIERDLADLNVQNDVSNDQIACYHTRAPWYDDVYTCTGDYDRGPDCNVAWLEDLVRIETALAAAPLHGECVELGAGTGYWSQRVIDRVSLPIALVERRRTQQEFSRALGDAGVSLEVADGPRVIYGLAVRNDEDDAVV